MREGLATQPHERLAAGFFGCFGFFGSLRGLSRLPMVVSFPLEDRQLTPSRPEYRRGASGKLAGTAYRGFEHRECRFCADVSLPASASWLGLSGVARKRSWVLPLGRVRGDRKHRVYGSLPSRRSPLN